MRLCSIDFPTDTCWSERREYAELNVLVWLYCDRTNELTTGYIGWTQRFLELIFPDEAGYAFRVEVVHFDAITKAIDEFGGA